MGNNMAHDFTDAEQLNATANRVNGKFRSSSDISWILLNMSYAAQTGQYYLCWRGGDLSQSIKDELKRRGFFLRKTRTGCIIYWVKT